MPSGITIAAIISVIVLGVIVVIQMIAITTLLLVMKNLAQDIRERVDPLISKANSLMVTVNEMARTVQEKTEHIAEKTAETSDVVGERVQKTSGVVQTMIATPLVKGASVAEGIAQGVRTWRNTRRRHTPAAPEAEVVVISPADDGSSTP